jgi:hypothetical protein
VTGKGSKHPNVAAFGTSQRTTGSAANAVAKTMLMALWSAPWLRAPPAWPEVHGCASLKAGRLERPHLPLVAPEPHVSLPHGQREAGGFADSLRL